MAISEDIEGGEIVLVLGLVVVIGYALYKVYGSVGAGLSSLWNSASAAVASVGTTITNAGVSVAKGAAPTGNLPSGQLDPNYVLPNSGGVTVGQLQNSGLSDSDIQPIVDASNQEAGTQAILQSQAGA